MSANSRILVIGGGISGITAAVEASEAGADVLLVEKNPYLGGRVAQLNLYFPKLCPPNCGLEINLRRFRTSPKIKYLTQAEVSSVTGEPGNYREASASAMFTYFFAKAVRKGYLGSDYRQVALASFEGLVQEFVNVHADGRISMTNQCLVAGLGYGRDGSYRYHFILSPVKLITIL